MVATSGKPLFKPVLNNALHIGKPTTSFQHVHEVQTYCSQSNLEQTSSLSPNHYIHSPPGKPQSLPVAHTTATLQMDTPVRNQSVDIDQEPAGRNPIGMGIRPADGLQGLGSGALPWSSPPQQTVSSDESTPCQNQDSNIGSSSTHFRALPSRPLSWRPEACLRSSLRHMRALHPIHAPRICPDSSHQPPLEPVPDTHSPPPSAAQYNTTSKSPVEPEFPSDVHMVTPSSAELVSTAEPNSDITKPVMSPLESQLRDLSMDPDTEHLGIPENKNSQDQVTHLHSSFLKRIRAKPSVSRSSRWRKKSSKPGHTAEARLAKKHAAYCPTDISPELPLRPAQDTTSLDSQHQQTTSFLAEEDNISSRSGSSRLEESTEDSFPHIPPFSDLGNSSHTRRPLDEPVDSKKLALRDQRENTGVENEDAGQGSQAVFQPRKKRRDIEDRGKGNEDGHVSKKAKPFHSMRDLRNISLAKPKAAVVPSTSNAFASSSRVTLEDLRAASTSPAPQDSDSEDGDLGDELVCSDGCSSFDGSEVISAPKSPTEVPTLARQVKAWVKSINEIMAARRAPPSPTVHEDSPSLALHRRTDASIRVQALRNPSSELHTILQAVNVRKAAVSKDEAHSGLAKALRRVRRLCVQHEEAENVRLVDDILDDFAQRFVGKRWPSGEYVHFTPAQGGRIVRT